MTTVYAIHFYFLLQLILATENQTTPKLDNRQPALPKVRSLSGGKATAGNNATDILNLITAGFLDGYAIGKVKSFNDRIYLLRYRRSYWLGTRYYYMDNLHYYSTRDTCLYQMDSREWKGLTYEDGMPIYDIVYQCQRYVEYCCGLTCCVDESYRRLDTSSLYQQIISPWHTSEAFTSKQHIFPPIIFFILLGQYEL